MKIPIEHIRKGDLVLSNKRRWCRATDGGQDWPDRGDQVVVIDVEDAETGMFGTISDEAGTLREVQRKPKPWR